ncbi:hypothetical protein A4A49_17090 [Nicotiana attenuata]|uniref:Uncharacterized protein n=1 Tax=Nicotiana attenuata TaxID=49451 RepID=A0A1J6IP59_NICAT|nr:hypothetical protein A4A49_17090 [Nicotiana attenuata]
MVSELINANPIVYEKKERRARSGQSVDEYAAETIDQLEIFDILLSDFILSSFSQYWLKSDSVLSLLSWT